MATLADRLPRSNTCLSDTNDEVARHDRSHQGSGDNRRKEAIVTDIVAVEKANSSKEKTMSENMVNLYKHEEEYILEVSKTLKDALESFKQTFVVSDATKPDCPILYASSGFYAMTGYSPEDVIGKNCRFLQGPATDQNCVAKIKDAVKHGMPFCGRLLNYKKDGTPFWNLLSIGPVKDDNGKLVKFIGAQVDISTGAGYNDLRPNGLPKSLICYDARLKDRALDSIEEVVQRMEPQGSETRGKTQESHVDFEPSKSVSATPMTNINSAEIDHKDRSTRMGLDLATTLERIERNFVVSDPRLPDNPIIFVSDSFLELTEYTREEILGRNCRFLQGPDTDQGTVSMIREAIKNQTEVSVQIINYTKSGKKFWNLFHTQPVHDQQGNLQYFIGVQLDGSDYMRPSEIRLSDNTEEKNTKLVKATADNVDDAIRGLPDGNLSLEDLWDIYSRNVFPRPHNANNASWLAIRKFSANGVKIGLHHFKPVKLLGYGDTGSVHLVELIGSGDLFAMKAMEKSLMLNRNKVHRVCVEREVLGLLDHPFLPTLYSSFQTSTHVCLITDFCPGGELFALLDRQPMKFFREQSARFYAAEVVIALEYLHCLGIVYRDLKPENILLREDGHMVLTDFDLSYVTSCNSRVDESQLPGKRKSGNHIYPTFIAQPTGKSNSFVGTEEYVAPEIISGSGHGTTVDWWALGILLYEMLFGRTPFRGKNRQRTFLNIQHKDVVFPTGNVASDPARDLINSLLLKDASKRLGSHAGAAEIKQHPFFNGIKWPLIRWMSPPALDIPLQLIGKEVESNDIPWNQF